MEYNKVAWECRVSSAEQFVAAWAADLCCEETDIEPADEWIYK